MPELPEVETMVRGARRAVTGRIILQMEFCACLRKPLHVEPAPKRFSQKVRSLCIDDITRLGKRIVISLGHPRPKMNPDGRHIVIEPRMTGLLLVTDPPTREHRRICWHLLDNSGTPGRLEFWDRRGLGTLQLLSTEQLRNLTASLGPDALQMTLEDWISRLKYNRQAIKVALLNQKLVAGIGNLYASEILHRSGIHPEHPSASLRTAKLRQLHSATQLILTEAVRCEGSTLSDGTYRNALNQDGSYQNHHQAYGRETQVCGRCRRGRIRRIVQAGRSTFFCPVCQK